jgi:hypothetical protein
LYNGISGTLRCWSFLYAEHQITPTGIHGHAES